MQPNHARSHWSDLDHCVQGVGSTGAVMRCTRIAEGREQQVALKVYHLGGAVTNSTAPEHDPRCTYNEVMRQ